MAENYTVQAKVVSLGNIEQIQYTDKQTGQPKIFTKFTVECQVNDTSVTYETAGFNQGKLVVGNSYTLQIQPDDQYSHKIRGIAPAGIVQPPQAQAPKPQASPAPAPVSPKPAVQALKPDFSSRWREYSTHARTAQMQATQRVEMLVDLIKAGKLVNDAGEVVEQIRKSTVEDWIIGAIDSYWKEVETRIPQDAWGYLVEDQNA